MLILQRKIDESFFIGSDIMVMVTAQGDDWVNLGISAPNDVSIARAELVAEGMGCPSHWDDHKIFAHMKESNYVFQKSPALN